MMHLKYLEVLLILKGGKLFSKDMNYNGDCLFNGSLSTLSKYDVFVDGKYHGIIDKLINLESITTLYKSQDYYKIQTNDKRLKPEKQMIQLNVMYLNKKGFEKYIDITEIKNRI
jgi:hypothetical protein